MKTNRSIHARGIIEMNRITDASAAICANGVIRNCDGLRLFASVNEMSQTPPARKGIAGRADGLLVLLDRLQRSS